jgi:hypothetical protein
MLRRGPYPQKSAAALATERDSFHHLPEFLPNDATAMRRSWNFQSIQASAAAARRASRRLASRCARRRPRRHLISGTVCKDKSSSSQFFSDQIVHVP